MWQIVEIFSMQASVLKLSSETIDYLESIIKAIIEFIYKLFHNFNIPKYEEKEFRKEFHEHIPSKLHRDKSEDDFEL